MTATADNHLNSKGKPAISDALLGKINRPLASAMQKQTQPPG
ncbi:MAG: hypothetical protein PVI82_12700 [Desulfobacterales bacterium]